MSLDLEAGLQALQHWVGRSTYSMEGSRCYADGTCDCSGAVYYGLRHAGGFAYGYIPSTETLHDYLTKLGFRLIAENTDFPMQRGDVIIWGHIGESAGAGGHTGIALDHQNWIECTAWYGGGNGPDGGTIISNHDARWAMAGGPYFYCYRYFGKPVTSFSTKTPSDHDRAVAASAPVHQGNAYGKLDYFNVISEKEARVAGWLVPDTPDGPIGACAEVLIMEHGTTNELARIPSQGISRPGVKRDYNYHGGDALGFDVTFDYEWMKKQHKVIDVILRRCNQANGEGAVNDVRISDIYLSL